MSLTQITRTLLKTFAFVFTIAILARSTSSNLQMVYAATPGSIGNRVWYDLNADGIQDVGEPGMYNVTVQLYNSDDSLAGTTTTNPSGIYSFSGLTADNNYYVRFIAPSGFVFSSQDVGDDALDSDADATGYTATFALPAEGTDDVDAGLHPPATVGDFVWFDLNANGVQDTGEPGMGNVTVELYAPGDNGQPGGGDDSLVLSTTTAFDGSYTFTNLTTPADYFVAFTAPEGFIFSPQDATTDSADSDADPATGWTAVFNLSPGVPKNDVDAGLYQPGSIGNFVWEDLDADGIQDAGELGLAGVTVTLYDVTATPVMSTTTDASGAYAFTDLAPGTYQLGFKPPADYFFSPQDMTEDALDSDADADGNTTTFYLDYAEDDDSWDAGLYQLGDIGDFVWDDLDGDGNQDGGPETGIADVTVALYDLSASLVATTTTDVDGLYTLTGVTPGTYTVTIDSGVPAGYYLTTANDPLSLTLVSGETYTLADFGYQQQTGAIGNFVWNDANGDGVQDVGESGIQNVTVYLDLNGNDSRDVGEPSDATDTNGAYDIITLPAGTYTVTVDSSTLPAGYVLTGGTDPLVVSLAAGEDFNDADFGYQQQNATIGDSVWNDLDGDGVQDGGEPGLSGVTVYLDLNGNGSLDTGEPSDTTDANGAYDIAGLAAGTYSVRVGSGVPAGFVLTTGNLPLSVPLTAGEDYNDADFGYQQQDASIGDFVWNDADGDGVQDIGETGLAGVTVYLDLNGNSSLDGGEPSDVTAAGGAYTITGLAAGVYTVTVDSGVPAGFVLTTSNMPLSVSLTAGQTYETADFGYRDPGTASIGDFVWNDLDGDGVQDGGEPGLTGVTVYLDLNGNSNLDGGEPFDTSDAGGAYDIAGLSAGTYTVTVDSSTIPAGFILTTANDPLVVSLTIGEDMNTADFGYQQQNATIGDFVWNDLDGDGVQDGGEPGLSGVTVYLDLNGNGSLDTGEPSDSTAANGAYDIAGLAAGAYSVRVGSGVPAGFVLTTGNVPLSVSLAAGEDYNNADFGYQQQDASIGDLVWNDADGDGVQDIGETGLDGVTVYLDLNDNGSLDGGEPSDTTSAAGAYDITGLAAGTYSVRVDGGVPAGYILTTGNVPLSVSLTAGEDFNDADFGYRDPGTASIGNFVWNDLDGDGVQDGGESGIDGVTLDLYRDNNNDGAIDAGDTNLGTQTTAGGGAYSFTNLVAGDYLVTVTDTSNVLVGYVLTGGDDPHDVALSLGQTYTDADFGYQARGTISGHLFGDTNGNGTEDGGETGLAGVTVVITDSFGIVHNATTNASGDYSVEVPTGSTTADVDDTTLPSGSVLTTANDPQTVAVNLGADTAADAVGYQQRGLVTGHLFEDVNGNGSQESGEPDLSGITVTITDSLSTAHSVTTDANGDYSLDVPTGNTTADVDDATLPSGSVLTTANDPQSVNVTGGSNGVTSPVGYQRRGTISGHLFKDSNGNGAEDAGETGLPGISVVITDSQGGFRIATTNASGDYSIEVPVGSTTADVDDTTLPSGSALTTANDPQTVTVTAAADTATTSVGYQQFADLTLTKSVSPAMPTPEGIITYTITFSNIGTEIATGVILTDVVPVELTGVSVSSSGAVITPTGSVNYVWQVENLAPGEDGTILITGTIDPGVEVGTVITNTAVIATTAAESNTDNNSAAATVTIRPDTYYVYLPVALNNYVSAPDLVITNLRASSNYVEVVIENQGNQATTSGFWVDFYVNPVPPPAAANELWPNLSSEGIAWGVTTAIAPGQVLTLTYSTAPGAPNLYYSAADSFFSGSLPVNTPIYAQVDSAHVGHPNGAIEETHEITGGAYNNIFQALATAVSPSNSLSHAPVTSAPTADLPRRH